MKEKYVSPDMEIIEFENEDVITGSPYNPDYEDDEPHEPGAWFEFNEDRQTKDILFGDTSRVKSDTVTEQSE